MRILSLFLIIYITGCAGPARHLCGNEYCGQDQWQNAINIIAAANFPTDEPYQGILWKDNFMNAWVTSGHTINITAKMNYQLETQSRRDMAGQNINGLNHPEGFSNTSRDGNS